MKFEAPQIIMVVLMAFGTGATISKIAYGKGDWTDLLVSFVATGTTVVLLWWGGFFG